MFEQLKNPGSGWETMKSLLSALSIMVCTIAAATLAGGSAQAQSFQPAIVFDMGGKFDKSFNEAAYTGVERFKKETGIE
jgi:basic membrane protein A and related proteins